MCLFVSLFIKLLLTHIIVVWLLAGMCKHVHLKKAKASKSFVTRIAFAWSTTHVCIHVCLKTDTFSKSTVTHHIREIFHMYASSCDS